MLRINAVNFKKPSPLYTLFSDPQHRDIISVIAAFASTDDLSQVKMSSKAAYFNINKWLDQSFNDPDQLLKVLGKHDKLQISCLLQKYFSHGSPYLENLTSGPNKDLVSAHACYALVADINDLVVDDLAVTLDWMRDNQISPHLISSIAFLHDFLDPPDNDEEERPMQLNEIIRLHPDAYLNFHGADLNREWLLDLDLRGANFQHTFLDRAQLSHSNLTGASLQHAVMERCNAISTNFSGANLQFANLDRAWMTSANFTNADLRFASLHHTDLRNAKLNGAQLQASSLERAKLIEADAVDADFSNANLSFANLQFTDMTDASLHQTTMTGTNLFGAAIGHVKLKKAEHDNEGEKAQKMRKLF